MPFLDPVTQHLNMKIALFGPDPSENARRLRAAHARAGPGVVLRQVHGDGKILTEGATMLFYDAPLAAPPIHGHALRLHLYALEGEPTVDHLSSLLLGVDGVVFVPGIVETTPSANVANLTAVLRQAAHKLPTAIVKPDAGEDDGAVIDRAVAAVLGVFHEYLVDG